MKQVIDGVEYEVKDNKYFYDKCLYIKQTYNGYLPDNLTISGSLYIDNSPRFKTLPKNLTVKGILYLRHTPITSLPSGLNVGDCLEMNYSKITSLPEDLKVGGSIDLSHTPIEVLPNNLIVNENLDLSYCTKLKRLPENLIVGKSLYINGCSNLEKLPKGLIVGGRLSIKGCKKIKEMLFNKTGGGLSLTNMTMETRISTKDALAIYKEISISLYTVSNNNIEYVLKPFEKTGITLNDLYKLIENSFGEGTITKYFKVMESMQQVEQMRQQNVRTLSAGKPIIITLNGVGFYKKLNQKLQKPFDSKFNKLMNKTIIYLLEKLPYTKIGYTWRYEMNIIINIPTYFNTNALWKRDVSKIQSIVASMASTFFTREYHKQYQSENDDDKLTLFEFNCQTWNTPTVEDAYNWLVYRQNECMDNSVKRFARFFLTTQEMKGKTADELIKYLIEHYNANWNYEKTDNKIGRLFTKQKAIQFDIDEKTDTQKVYQIEEWSQLALFYSTFKDEKIKEIIINDLNKRDE